MAWEIANYSLQAPTLRTPRRDQRGQPHWSDHRSRSESVALPGHLFSARLIEYSEPIDFQPSEATVDATGATDHWHSVAVFGLGQRTTALENELVSANGNLVGNTGQLAVC